MSRGRPREGQLILRKKGYVARIAMPDGTRKCFELDTTNRSLARRKLNRLLSDGAEDLQSAARRAETFREACERVLVQREQEGLTDTPNARTRLARFAYPEIGALAVDQIEPHHVNAILDAAKAAGKAKGTVWHLKQDMSTVFAALVRAGEIKTNPAKDAEMPRFRREVQKERAVLTDAELATYLAWEHPDSRYQGAARERQIMSVLARCFGGLRTGDLHALRWESFDVADGHFEWGWAPRQKTRRPQRIVVPEALRPYLREWWDLAGRPQTGLLFGVRKGDRLGETRVKGASHAREFRRDLRRALGIDRLEGEHWVQVRELTPRERELFEETETTLPVDFHSWRRAFVQGLADAAVNAQTAMALAGHASLGAHQRYLANAGKAREIPNAALPRLPAQPSGPADPAPVEATAPATAPTDLIFGTAVAKIENPASANHSDSLVSRDRIELSTRGFSGNPSNGNG